MLCAAAGCDKGVQTDERYDLGAPVHVVASNIGTNLPLPVNQPIELAFDRLLLPITVTRQSFELDDSAGTSYVFTIAYDPVARVVTITPLPPPANPALIPNQTYTLKITSPLDPTDSTGLHAIDGATMDPNSPRTITFQTSAAGTAPTMCGGVVGRCMSFCTDVLPIFGYTGGAITCSGSSTCHSGGLAASGGVALGLALTGPKSPTAAQPAMVINGKQFPAVAAAPSAAQYILATAINRLSVESTMGALSAPGPASMYFGQDMPIIDATTLVDITGASAGPQGSGDPGNSFLMYKVLMAEPPVAAPMLTVYSLTWPEGQPGIVPALPDNERATLANFIVGREMPLPDPVTATPGPGLSIDSLEILSLWIAQGAPLSNCP